MISNPLISVIMPTFNSESTIGKSIRSVLNQTYQNLELIIIDDNSIDDTRSIINSFSDSRIVYYKFTYNQGPALARDKGLELSHGEYIAFLDSDDIWKTDKIQLQLYFMIKHNILFSYSYYDLVNFNGTFKKHINNIPNVIRYKNLLNSNFIPMLTTLIDRHIFKYGIFKSVHHEDYSLWLRLFRRLNLCAYLYPKVLAKYRVNKKSVSHNKFKSILWVWYLYHDQENMSFIKSCLHIICFIFYGINKHQNLF